MRRSKLEMYIDILIALANQSPLKLTHIMYKTNIAASVLTNQLNFLISKNLVERQLAGKQREVYAITDSGLSVLRYFGEVKQVLPIAEKSKQTERDLLKIPMFQGFRDSIR